MEHTHFQQTHLSFWSRNAAICGRKNNVLAQVFSNRVAGNVLRRTIQHTLYKNADADVDGISHMWLSAKDCPGGLPAPVERVSSGELHRGVSGDSSPFPTLGNRQQLLCAIHLRDFGGFDFGAHIMDHKICSART